MIGVDIEKMLDEIGIPHRYHHFEVEDAVSPPFICWVISGMSNFAADGIVYYQTNQLDIELYTDEKDFVLEKNVESVLHKHGLFWNKSETYIESEQMYKVLYEMEA